MTLEIVDDFDRWIELVPEWQHLESSVPHLTPFQTSQWQLTWWRRFGSGELRVFVLRDGQARMVGLVPCFLHEWEGSRQLTLIGSGISDYLEPAIAPAFCKEIVDCFRDHLTATAGLGYLRLARSFIRYSAPWAWVKSSLKSAMPA